MYISQPIFKKIQECGADKAPDMLWLYLFYTKTADIQKTNSIKAANEFCQYGVTWGRKRFDSTKKLLEKNRLIKIKNVINKEATNYNKIPPFTQYIVVQYYETPTMFHKSCEGTSCEGTSCEGTTNAIKNKDILYKPKTVILPKGKITLSGAKKDFIKNNIKITDEMNKIFDYWNSISYKGFTKHQSITSSICKDKKNIKKSYTLAHVLQNVLKKYDSDVIIRGINTYLKIFISDKYWYSYQWSSLSDFLTSDKGLQQFLPNNKPKELFIKKEYLCDIDVIEGLRKKFKPITKPYSQSNLLDKLKNTYYGFPTDSLTDVNYIYSLEVDIKERFKDNNMSYGYFEWLEMVIASNFFRRKGGINEDLVIELFSYWEFEKDKWVDVANRIKEDL